MNPFITRIDIKIFYCSYTCNSFTSLPMCSESPGCKGYPRSFYDYSRTVLTMQSIDGWENRSVLFA